MKRILLLLPVTAVMVLALAPAAWAQVWPPEEKAAAAMQAPTPEQAAAVAASPTPQQAAAAAPAPPPLPPQPMPQTGGPALLPLSGAVAVVLGLSTGLVYLRSRR